MGRLATRRRILPTIVTKTEDLASNRGEHCPLSLATKHRLSFVINAGLCHHLWMILATINDKARYETWQDLLDRPQALQ
jgi:hypothetical protein